MAQQLLQEHLYGDLLAPRPDYHTDFAMGMTYSLSFDTLMTAYLAFGMLGDADEKAVQCPHVLLEAILKNSDKTVIFCNKGSIDVPPTIRKVYSLLEKSIFEVFNPSEPAANFHPKMWLIRDVHNNNKKDILLKLIVSSRNMAYSDTIDCIVALTGKVHPFSQKNKKHKVLRTFIEKVVRYSNIGDEQRQKVLVLAKELESVEYFNVSAPFEDYDFFPYLFKEDFGLGKVEDYLRGTESVIVSPFIDKKLLDRIIAKGEHQALITREKYVDTNVFNKFNQKGGIYVALDDLVHWGMDLHAKMYLVWMGRDEHYLYLGSANATNSAFERNGELLLRLKFKHGNSKYHHFLKEFYEEGNKDSKFTKLKTPIEETSTIDRRDEAELAMKDLMCAKNLSAKITRQRDGQFSIVVTSNLKKLGYPVFIAPMQKQSMLTLWEEKATFKGLTADELSEFYIISSQTKDKRHKGVIKIATEGMPDNRDQSIYKSIIKSKQDFITFLELMLSESPMLYMANELARKDSGTATTSEERYEFPQVYEKMLRVAATKPATIFQIGEIFGKLDATIVPEEFQMIYKQFVSAIK